MLHATHAQFLAERHRDADEDVHFTRDVAAAVISALTQPDEVVFDPFAGFGTTLSVAQQLRRVGVGLELLPDRVATVRTRVPAASIGCGDARQLDRLVHEQVLPIAAQEVTLCLTSPPYMTRNQHPANPLTGYRTSDGDYAQYLTALQQITQQVRTLLRPGGYLVMNVADIRYLGVDTPLIADVRQALESTMALVAQIPILWDRLPHDLTSDALLVWQH